MSRIIKPQGVPVARVVIEIDSKNQMQVRMENLKTVPVTPLHPMVAAQMISACLPSIIGSMMGQQIEVVNSGNSEEKTNGSPD